MKKIIIIFIISILSVAFIVGKCNSDETNVYDSVATETYVIPTKDTINDNIITIDTNSIEIPVILYKNYPDKKLYRIGYSVSYNEKTKCPNWVAWHLTAEHTDGPYKRLNNFYEELNVPRPRATLEDYKGSGWSRGHMCPAGDNKWSEEAMYQSFSLVNVCPQDARLNSGLWNSFEIDCRRWAHKFQDIYIVCGPVFYRQEHVTIGDNRVYVPEAFFKVVLCLNGKPKGLGIVVKNNSGTKKNDLYYNSIDQVERITGYDFFPALPDSIEDEVEAVVNMDLWK